MADQEFDGVEGLMQEPEAVPGGGPARLTLFLLCDRAEILKDKLYIMGGGIRTFNARSFPAQIRFSIAIEVLVPWAETNREIPLEFRFETADGQHIGSAGIQFAHGRPPLLRGEDQHAMFAISDLALGVPETSQLVAIASIDGKEQRRITFQVQAAGG
ncbi:MAG: hypothetical protein U0556_09990 [Dehalococcoidia bacterium]